MRLCPTAIFKSLAGLTLLMLLSEYSSLIYAGEESGDVVPEMYGDTIIYRNFW